MCLNMRLRALQCSKSFSCSSPRSFADLEVSPIYVKVSIFSFFSNFLFFDSSIILLSFFSISSLQVAYKILYITDLRFTITITITFYNYQIWVFHTCRLICMAYNFLDHSLFSPMSHSCAKFLPIFLRPVPQP